MGIYYNDKGQVSPHPWDREEARRLQSPRYMTSTVCGDCKACSIRFTRNGGCIQCCRLKAIDAYNRAALNGVATSIDMAIAKGTNRVTTPDMCRLYGHEGLRDLNNNCVYCVEARNKPSPRQAAIDAHEKWYTPDIPCSKCHTHAKKYVANGRCLGCNPLQQIKKESAERAMIKDYPILIFNRARAIRGGLTIFRTGERCSNGHTTYRRVADGSCISCS